MGIVVAKTLRPIRPRGSSACRIAGSSRRRLGVLRGDRVPAERRRRAHLGLPVVEPADAVADLCRRLSPFFVVAFWVHDMPTLRQKVRAVGVIYAFDAACLLLFGAWLRWI